MSLPALDNLVRIGQLKPEPRNDLELKRMLDMARSRLADARLASQSLAGVGFSTSKKKSGRVRGLPGG